MSALSALTLRIALNQASRDALTEKRTSRPPVIWIGNRVDLQFAAFLGTPSASTLVDDWSNVTGVNLVIRASSATGTVQINESLLLANFDNEALEWAHWQDDSDQHFTFELDDSDTNQAAGIFWWAVEAITTDSGPITLGTGTGEWKQDGIGNAGTPEAPDYTAYSRTEADARFIGPKGYASATPSAAGNTDVSTRHTQVSPSAGAGAYTHTLALLTADVDAGDQRHILLRVPASANPTIEIRNATSGGTLLHSEPGTGAARDLRLEFLYTGSAWIKFDAHDIL